MNYLVEQTPELICPVAHELQPLGPESDRREVQRRLIGPLAAVATINSIDELRESAPEVIDGCHSRLLSYYERLENDEIEQLVIGGSVMVFRDVFRQHDFAFRETITGRVARHAEAYGQREGPGFCMPDRPYLTRDQQSLFRANTHFAYLHPIVAEGFQAQFNTTFNIALPGYLIARDELENPEEIVNIIKIMGIDGVAEILGKPDFRRALARLPITANGLYNEGSASYVDQNKDEFGREFTSYVIDTQHFLTTDEIEKLEQIGINPAIPKVRIWELFEKRDAEINLSQAALDGLNFFLKVRNHPDCRHTGTVVEGVRSKGCPVVQKTAYVREDDFTERQWDDLTGGENPIAQYDPERSKLTFLRSTIDEVGKLIIDALTGRQSVAY